MSETINWDDIGEIQQLAETLESLNLKINYVTQRRNELIKRNTCRGQTSSYKPRKRNEYKVGDLVQVKDNYKGRKNIKGIVTDAYLEQVFLELISGTCGFRKYKENIRLLKEADKHEQRTSKHRY